MNDYIFRQGTSADVSYIMELIKQRIEWMDKEGINQWNKTHYLEHYPSCYYKHAAERGVLYVLSNSNNQIIASTVVLTEDERWMPTDTDALYVHNLVAAIGERGAGKKMIQYVEELAHSQNKNFVRLDCAIGNEELNKWYEKLGYKSVGTTVDGEYQGCLREKKL